MRSVSFSALKAVDDSTNQTSAKIDGNQLFALSLVASFSDTTAAGSVKFQGSNDPTNASNIVADFTPTNWVDIPNGSVAVTAGGQKTVQINPICYRWYRVVWTQTTPGVGTLTVNVNEQGF